MRRDDRDQRRETQGGIPDGLLIGVLAFLFGMTLLAWTATGLAGWFARGAWPEDVTFARTPLAMRHLIGQPHDIPGAWPATPATQLSGYGLFWGLLISQLMVLLVLTVFVRGTLTRWRAVRTRRRVEQRSGRAAEPGSGSGSAEPRESKPAPLPSEAARTGAPGPEEPPATDSPLAAETAPFTEPPAPVTLPAPRAPTTPIGTANAANAPSPADTANAVNPTGPVGTANAVNLTGPVILGPAKSRYPLAVQAVRDAKGPALVITSNPTLWAETKDARAKRGPVLLYDPSHLCDTPARLHWSPSRGCEDKATAAARAAALLSPVRPTAKIDQPLADVAETLLRCCLHAAAVDSRTVRHLHRWAQGTQMQEAVRALRTNPKAASGTAGELESALTSHPERRDMAQELTARALSSLSTINIRESCIPHRADSLALDSFIDEGGTLYVVGEPLEDPRATPGAVPLLTALTASVVERGRRMAERSFSGRLDPPLTLILDDVAAVAPLPQLPDLLTGGADRGIPTLALMRSREQSRSRWPQYELPV